MSTQTRIHLRSPLPAAEAKALGARAAGQEALISEWFRRHPDARLTPPEIQRVTGLDRAPLTSVRRAITNLTRLGLLKKHEDDQRRGQYGVSNCTWGLASARTQGVLFG